MDIIITKKKPDPMGSATWYYGTAGEYAFEAKVYGEPSIFGIDEGRISKLWMMQPPGWTPVATYDRGWDRLPRTQEQIDCLQAIIDALN